MADETYNPITQPSVQRPGTPTKKEYDKIDWGDETPPTGRPGSGDGTPGSGDETKPKKEPKEPGSGSKHT